MPGDTPIRVFTDGACRGNPGPGGWGAIVRIGGDERELSGAVRESTNNRMELTGAIRGLAATPEGSAVEVCADSQYVVKGMTQWVRGWVRNGWRTSDRKPVQNRELWEELVALASRRRVRWHWVEGHAGHAENERCDQLANRAIDELLLGE